MKILLVICLVTLVCLVIDYSIYYVRTQRALKKNDKIMDLDDKIIDASKQLINEVIEKNKELEKENERLRSVLNS